MNKLSWARRAHAVFILCAATAITLPAQTFKTLHSFDGADGSEASGALVQATNGNLYGTTSSGGTLASGTVFKIAPSGRLTSLYSFCSVGTYCLDGAFPEAGLVQAANGNLYGTTFFGGPYGAGVSGTVFKITPTGTLTTLYSFCSQGGSCPDGSEPAAGLVEATDGNLYGTTQYGGANGDYGTIFEITPSGTLTTLYSFCSQSNCTDGAAPRTGLVQANNGDLYGTTTGGGASDTGTVFKITPSGTLTTLYSFCSHSNCTDGDTPTPGLVQAIDGNFYGTTIYGGASGGSNGCPRGCGTAFRITPSGTLTTFYNFCSQSTCTDGDDPQSGLVQATDGNFYGTTGGGGAHSGGTIFKITPEGTLTTLYSFCSQRHCADGGGPAAALLQATDGAFYGTTTIAGGLNNGTVFSLSVGLGPFVETQPAYGKVGAVIKILGTNLTGATRVTFNGTPAVFTVLRDSVITTSVPVGATTGTVEVVTPSGTLSSNVPFRVVP